MSLSGSSDYTIGVEIECLLDRPQAISYKARQDRGKPRRTLSRRALYADIIERMNRFLRSMNSSEKVKVHNRGKTVRPTYEVWTLIEDSSLEEGKGQVPVEVVSPKLEHQVSNNAGWRNSLSQIFDSLADLGIDTNKTCALHVHLSPKPGLWIEKNLHKIACCILFFEEPMELLYPPDYRQNMYAVTNGVDNPNFNVHNLTDHQGLKNCFKAICETKTRADFVELMNPKADRYYGWNFMNLTLHGIGTIEFRRPPGVTRSDICQNWADLAVAFITAATLLVDTQDLFIHYPHRNAEALERFLGTGLPKGEPVDGHFGNLFNDVGGNVAVQRCLRRLGG